MPNAAARRGDRLSVNLRVGPHQVNNLCDVIAWGPLRTSQLSADRPISRGMTASPLRRCAPVSVRAPPGRLPHCFVGFRLFPRRLRAPPQWNREAGRFDTDNRSRCGGQPGELCRVSPPTWDRPSSRVRQRHSRDDAGWPYDNHGRQDGGSRPGLWGVTSARRRAPRYRRERRCGRTPPLPGLTPGCPGRFA